MRTTRRVFCLVVIVAVIFTTQTLAQNLVTNPGFETGAPLKNLPTTYGVWSGDSTEYVTAQYGIDPYENSQMLRFVGSSPNGAGPPGTAHDGTCVMWQLIDVSAYTGFIQSGAAFAEARMYCNRIYGDSETDTEFGIVIYAFSGDPSTFPGWVGELFLARSFDPTLLSDGIVTTWEPVEAGLMLPIETDYIALLLYAFEKKKNDQRLPEFDGHYADWVTLAIGEWTPVPTMSEWGLSYPRA
jgi:hypothetical protein